MDYHPIVFMASRFELAHVLWKELGISYVDLNNMDPIEVNRLMTIYNIRSEILGPKMSGCPFS